MIGRPPKGRKFPFVDGQPSVARTSPRMYLDLLCIFFIFVVPWNWPYTRNIQKCSKMTRGEQGEY